MKRLGKSLSLGVGALCLLWAVVSLATAATTCKTVTQVHRGTHLVFVWRIVHGKRAHVYRLKTIIVHNARHVVRVPVTVRRAYVTVRHVQVCESAVVSMSTNSVPTASGGSSVIRYSSKNASRCTLSSSPTFWTGPDPLAVPCNGTYTAAVLPSAGQRQWTFRFTAKNGDGQSVSSTQTLTEQAPVASLPVTDDQSYNWSGYADAGGPFTGAQGGFNVPNLLHISGDTSEWVGLDGFSNSTLIQAGIHEQYDRTAGGLHIWAWWEVLPAPETPIASMVVAPGDHIAVRISQLSGPTWAISIADTTTGQRYSTDRHYAGSGASAEWIVEAPSFVGGGLATLGQYTPAVTFGGLGVNGTQVGLTALIMVKKTDGLAVSTPSLLDANGFSVAYGAVAPAAP